MNQRKFETAVAHAGQLHRRHDGARRLLAGLFQLDSIATDPALGSNSRLPKLCGTGFDSRPPSLLHLLAMCFKGAPGQQASAGATSTGQRSPVTASITDGKWVKREVYD
jgi:hypothetical protein